MLTLTTHLINTENTDIFIKFRTNITSPMNAKSQEMGQPMGMILCAYTLPAEPNLPNSI